MKYFKYLFFLTSLFLFLPSVSLATSYETRGVWISRHEWKTEADIENLIDLAYKTNFNTIFFQVRGNFDALYHSNIEPWSDKLTGTLGEDPGWDPLQTAIREAHNRGMKLHAWINSFTFWSRSYPPPETTPRHAYLTNPEWVMVDKNKKAMTVNDNGYIWASPGNPEVTNRVYEVVIDIIKHYNVDGIHLDFLRYPTNKYSYDQVSLDRYKSKSGNPDNLSWDDWRRDQITRMVRKIYKGINQVKPKVLLSAAVWGYYRDYWNWGYDNSSGFVYRLQDSRRWVREKIVDFLVPMIYYDLNPPLAFDVLARDFIDNSYGRHIYPGIGLYRVTYSGWPFSEIVNQVEKLREMNAPGLVMFSITDVKNYSTKLKELFPDKVEPSILPWKDSWPPPAKIIDLIALPVSDSQVELRWTAPGADGMQGQAASYDIRYSTSKITEANWDLASKLEINLEPKKTNSLEKLTVSGLEANKIYYFAIKTTDSAGAISDISNIASSRTLETILNSSVNEEAVGEGEFLWKTFDFKVAGGIANIEISATVGQNSTTLDWQKLTFGIDDDVYDFNSPLAFKGEILQGAEKTINIRRFLKNGSHTLKIYAFSNPTLNYVKIFGRSPTNSLLYASDDIIQGPDLDKYKLEQINFQSESGEITLVISAKARSNGSKDDDDLKVVINGKDYGWLWDGDTLQGKIKTITIKKTVTRGWQNIILYADRRPLIHRILIYGPETSNSLEEIYNEKPQAADTTEFYWRKYNFTLAKSKSVKLVIGATASSSSKLGFELYKDGILITDYSWLWDGSALLGRNKVKVFNLTLLPGSYMLYFKARANPILQFLQVRIEN